VSQFLFHWRGVFEAGPREEVKDAIWKKVVLTPLGIMLKKSS